MVRSRLPIQVVIVDTGPLISLAACDHLELLMEFRQPVRVPDVIKAECLRNPEKIDAATLVDWFGSPDCPVEILSTPLMSAWMQAVATEATDPASHESIGLGDAAIAWLLRQDRLATGRIPTMVVTEDAPSGDGVIRDRFPEIHVLSTRALLQTLENFGRIASAEHIINQLALAGRHLARYMADRPGRPVPATRTSWADVLHASNSLSA